MIGSDCLEALVAHPLSSSPQLPHSEAAAKRQQRRALNSAASDSAELAPSSRSLSHHSLNRTQQPPTLHTLRSSPFLMALSRGWFLFLAMIAAIVGFSFRSAGPPPSPLLHAAFRGDIELIKRLLPIEPATTATASASASAASASFAAHVRNEANARDHWNNTALHWACKGAKGSSVAIAQHLLAAGVDPLAQNQGGSTALHWACSVADGSIALPLLDLLLSPPHSVPVNAANAAGETPLHWAVDWLAVDSVQYLLQHGADVNATDSHNNTALHKIKSDCDQSAACNRLVSLLVQAGSDVMAKNAFGRTPLQHFNQDAEGQSQRAAKEADIKRQREAAMKEEASGSTIGGSSGPNPHLPPPPSKPLRVTDAQIDQIQAQFEEFKRNMTLEGAPSAQAAQDKQDKQKEEL